MQLCGFSCMSRQALRLHSKATTDHSPSVDGIRGNRPSYSIAVKRCLVNGWVVFCSAYRTREAMPLCPALSWQELPAAGLRRRGS